MITCSIGDTMHWGTLCVVSQICPLGQSSSTVHPGVPPLVVVPELELAPEVLPEAPTEVPEAPPEALLAVAVMPELLDAAALPAAALAALLAAGLKG